MAVKRGKHQAPQSNSQLGPWDLNKVVGFLAGVAGCGGAGRGVEPCVGAPLQGPAAKGK